MPEYCRECKSKTTDQKSAHWSKKSQTKHVSYAQPPVDNWIAEGGTIDHIHFLEPTSESIKQWVLNIIKSDIHLGEFKLFTPFVSGKHSFSHIGYQKTVKHNIYEYVSKYPTSLSNGLKRVVMYMTGVSESLEIPTPDEIIFRYNQSMQEDMLAFMRVSDNVIRKNVIDIQSDTENTFVALAIRTRKLTLKNKLAEATKAFNKQLESMTTKSTLSAEDSLAYRMLQLEDEKQNRMVGKIIKELDKKTNTSQE